MEMATFYSCPAICRISEVEGNAWSDIRPVRPFDQQDRTARQVGRQKRRRGGGSGSTIFGNSPCSTPAPNIIKKLNCKLPGSRGLLAVNMMARAPCADVPRMMTADRASRSESVTSAFCSNALRAAIRAMFYAPSVAWGSWRAAGSKIQHRDCRVGPLSMAGALHSDCGVKRRRSAVGWQRVISRRARSPDLGQRCAFIHRFHSVAVRPWSGGPLYCRQSLTVTASAPFSAASSMQPSQG